MTNDMSEVAAQPVILAVAHDQAVRAALGEVLRRRFAADYTVSVAGTADEAVTLLEAHRDAGDPVALVLAQLRLGGGGVEFLVRARDLHRSARRIIVLDVGDGGAAADLHQALTMNHIDMYFGQPWASPEEELYPVVGAALRAWAREHLPRYEKAVIVDETATGRGAWLRSWLDRNGVAAGLYLAESARGIELLAGELRDVSRLPAVLLWNGAVLVTPADDELAAALGAPTRPLRQHYDVAVVGGGPAGLAAATYASSDGLATIVVEQLAWGGQAGTSSKIRNYLGFQWGTTGADLAEAAERQAAQLGAEFVVARSVTGLSTDGEERTLTLSNGDRITATSVVIAAGVSYRRLGVPSVDALVGSGVFYGGHASDARTMGGLDVFVLGGGNSAGQAASNLAAAGARVTVVIRGSSLGPTMSDYLQRELAASPRIQLLCESEIIDAGGPEHLQHLVIRHAGDTTTAVPADALFIFIGARPHTAWLGDMLALDKDGYVLTGQDLMEQQPSAWPLTDRPPAWLETSLPAVFAAGDIRHGSTKRVAAAVGEGSTAAMLVGSCRRIPQRKDPAAPPSTVRAGEAPGLAAGAMNT
jgi:thioredoxin reductase (NADPH)